MSIDAAAFARDLGALRAELSAAIGAEDAAHFRKMSRWGRAATALGWATAWVAPNPISAALLSIGATARWTIVAHHTLHGGLDRAPGGPRAKTYARGERRWLDWLDWLDRDAWVYEHNVVHHGRVGEVRDPDLVEENMRELRDAPMSRSARWAIVAFYACTWRLTYYAPNTWSVFRRAKGRRRDKGDKRNEVDESDVSSETYRSAFDPRSAEGRAFLRSLLPYSLARFVIAPLAFSPLGPWAVASVFANSAFAEVLTNIHTFVLIAPNHAGSDLYRFDTPAADAAEQLVRQVVGTANYTGGSDVKDFLQGFLNYQIEHHLWPDLPPLKYRQARERVREICAKHGVPYVEEGVFRRLQKLFEIMLGDESMGRTKDARSVGAGRPPPKQTWLDARLDVEG